MASPSGSYELECGTLHVFLELPDRAVRDALVAEALEAMQKALQKPDPARPTLLLGGPEASPVFGRLTAHLAATRDLAARMKAARDGGDPRAEERLFRAIVIAKWVGDALIEALTPEFLASLSSLKLIGGKTLELVAQTGHSGAVRLISFSADGSRLITAAGDGRAISWAAATGDELHTFWFKSDLLSEPAGVALSPDGRRMVVVGDGLMAVHYPLRDASHPLRSEVDFKPAAAARFVAFSSDGAHLFTSGAETIVWTVGADAVEEARTLGKQGDVNAHQSIVGRPRPPLPRPGPDLRGAAAFSPRGDLVLTGGPNHEAILWSAGTGARLHTLAGHAAPLRAAAFSADGARAATVDTAGVVILWDAYTGARLLDLATTDNPTSIALSPDGRLLLTVSPGAGARLLELDAHPPGPRAAVARALGRIEGAIRAADLSPSAASPLLVVGTADGALHAIDYRSGDAVWSVEAMRLAPTWIDFAAGGRRFTVAREDGTEHVWDAGSGGLVEVRAATPRDPPMELESIFSGQVIRSRQGGEEIGYYEPREGNTLIRVERLAPVGRWLLTHRDGQVNVLDERPRPGQWLFTAVCEWGAQIAQATTAALSPDGRFVLGGTPGGTVELWKVGSAERLCTLLSLADGRWAVADDEGRYDASHRGEAAGLHWVLELEPIELSQLKLRYYDPTLLTKKMQLRVEPPRAVTRLAPALSPAVTTTIVTTGPGTPALRLSLVDRGGGIGTIRIAINGKEAFVGRLAKDELGGEPFLQMDGQDSLPVDVLPLDKTTGAVLEIACTIPLAGHPYLHPDGAGNRVTVVAMNADDVLASRGIASRFAGGRARPIRPTLWGIVAGISRYQGSSLQLSYAGKDAADFGAVLELAGAPLFEGRAHVRVLSTESEDTSKWPTRANLEAAFRWAHAGAKSEDVLVVYLAGHGVQANDGKDDEFYYLTQDAVEGALADPVVWRGSTLSSDELTAWIKGVPALKQVLLLDTCHAGRLVADLTKDREVPSSELRAIERMKDRTGLFVLAGAAADAVSYEASRYAQGLLTYALLSGIRGPALREGKFIDVGMLYSYAVDRVPQLAEGIRGVQQPLLAVPGGGESFDIGAVDAEISARIRLAGALPFVQRSSFQDEEAMDDALALSEKVDAALRDQAAARPAPFVFIEGTGLSDALRPAGRYRAMADGSIRATVRLSRGHVRVVDGVVDGRADALDALARRIAEVVVKSARGAHDPGVPRPG
jgi:WD40 repeat protein/uncharacterized caspase-like protein